MIIKKNSEMNWKKNESWIIKCDSSKLHVHVNKGDFSNNNFLILNLLKNKLKIGAIYRQPNNTNDPCGSIFLNFYENLLSKHSNMILFGDFNINLLENSELVLKYQNSYSLNGYFMLNKTSTSFPTRINRSTNSVSCIDHVISDTHISKFNFSYNFFLFDLIADHKSIMLNIKANNSQKF